MQMIKTVFIANKWYRDKQSRDIPFRASEMKLITELR